MRTTVRTVLCVLLISALLLGCTGNVFAIGSSFFETHTDWHFQLERDPNRAMRVDELIALSTAYSYWGVGQASGETPRDRNGNLPEDWAAPYIRAEYAKGTFDPSKIAYNEPATLAFWMQFVAGCKGLFSYNANNLYTFTGLSLTPEERLLMSAAVDYGLVSYTQDMNVSGTLPRKDLESKYTIPEKALPAPKPIIRRAQNIRWSEAFFEDFFSLSEFRAELERIRASDGAFNLINLHMMTLGGDGVTGSYIETNRIAEIDSYAGGIVSSTLDYCKRSGIKVVVGFANPVDSRRDKTMSGLKQRPEDIPRLADEMVAYVDRYDLDGLELTVEIYNTLYRETYKALLKALSERLHARGKMLIATVGGYTTYRDESQSLYDYKTVAECCDLVNLTLYDDHSKRSFEARTSDEGELSHYNYARQRILYAIANFGAERVIASYGLYGVDYDLTDRKAENIHRQTVFGQIPGYAAQIKTHGMPTDDAYYEYTVNGKHHIVYFDSDEGLRRRIDMAVSYGLAGVNMYSLLSDAPAIFDMVKEALHALPFVDVEKGWYYEPVRWALEQGVTTGTSATTFGPDRGCTRAQVVTFLWRAAGQPAPRGGGGFGDVSPNAYYADAVAWAVERGITNGTGEGRFSPDATCTRAQIVTFLWRFRGSPPQKVGNSPFGDVPAGAYYENAVAWAVENEITTGTAPGRFSPDSTCTRAQVVTFLYRDLGDDPYDEPNDEPDDEPDDDPDDEPNDEPDDDPDDEQGEDSDDEPGDPSVPVIN